MENNRERKEYLTWTIVNQKIGTELNVEWEELVMTIKRINARSYTIRTAEHITIAGSYPLNEFNFDSFCEGTRLLIYDEEEEIG